MKGNLSFIEQTRKSKIMTPIDTWGVSRKDQMYLSKQCCL